MPLYDVSKNNKRSQSYIFKELLAHLGHYNYSIKLDSINNIRNIIQSNEELIKLELSSLLENICPLFSDRNYKVREASMSLFKTIILSNDLIKRSLLIPFYGLINVHLSCAMTNILDEIQYSSLKLLDILIDHLPDLVRMHSNNIFENFLDQISKTTLKGDKRILKNDPYKLTSTQSWRQNVLIRMYNLLSIVGSHAESNFIYPQNDDSLNNPEIKNVGDSDKQADRNIFFDETRNLIVFNYSNYSKTTFVLR
jgi:hypothetical protein